MAELPTPTLQFLDSCRQCARRDVELPAPLPPIGDDFDWRVRDFEGFRRFMLEDLAARFPERTRWTAADLEVVLIDAFAAVLDQLSDMLDRVASEATLETARRPDSVRRLLELLGVDAQRTAGVQSVTELLNSWEQEPARMEAARRAGPTSVHVQRRMVSLQDYADAFEAHPLVNRAHASLRWNGSWPVVRVALTLFEDYTLDAGTLADLPEKELGELALFHANHGLLAIDPKNKPKKSTNEDLNFRMLLHAYLERERMLGQEVHLEDAEPVGIELALSLRVRSSYFQSEVRREVERVLGRGPSGFFLPGRLKFGEDLHVADIIQGVMVLDGVENVCINRFRRLGRQFAAQAPSGRIVLEGLQIAVCDNDPMRPARGHFRLNLHGGRAG